MMKTIPASVSFLIIFLFTGWLAASYSTKTADQGETRRLRETQTRFPLNSTGRAELISRTLRAAYPGIPEYRVNKYSLVIGDLSGRFNLSWSMIAATIWVESRFDPARKSLKDAKGLMQLLENTAAGQALKTGIKYSEDKTVWDDVTNLSLGARYLLEGYEKEGNFRQTAYYYLAGPRWRKTIVRNSRMRDCLWDYASAVLREKTKLDILYLGISVNDDNRLSFRAD